MNNTFEEFVAPWRDTFPALALAELYAVPDQRASLLARAVLVMECSDAVWRASDERVTAAKLGWWAEEWTRIHEGNGRHPISSALKTTTQQAPLRPLLEEIERPGFSDWSARCSGYAQIGDGFAQSFALPTEGDRERAASALCWTALIASRHLAAVWSALSPAIQRLPLESRARHQLRADASVASSAQTAAIEGGQQVARALQIKLDELPMAAWSNQRGARVLTTMALRELRQLGKPPSRFERWRNGYAAWRSAQAAMR